MFDSRVRREHIYPFLISVVVSAIVLLLFSATTSPIYNLAYSDGRVFQYVGMAIAEGRIPYVDVFDNKGPFLYFINYIAFLLDEEYGILGLQWLHLSIFFYLCFRLHQSLHSCHFYSWVLPLLITFIVRYLGDGNLTEEWSLSLLIIPLFYIIPLYQGDRTDILPSQSFFYGLCVGLLALLRLNNAVPLLAILLLWLIDFIQRKQFASLARFIAFASIGFLLPVVAAALWFYQKAGLYGIYEWIYATIIVNFVYFKNQITIPSEIPLWKILPAVFFHVIFICLCLFRHRKPSQSRLVLSLVLTFLLTYLTIGQSWYAHYQMILIPTFLVSFCLLSKNHLHLALSVLLLTSIYMCKYVVGNEWKYYQENSINTEYQQEFAQVIDMLSPAERNQLWNLNATIYHFVDVAYYQRLFPVNRVDRPSLTVDTYPQPSFVDQQPLWVIVDENDLDQQKAETHFLLQHYQSVACTHSEHRHNLSLYKRVL